MKESCPFPVYFPFCMHESRIFLLPLPPNWFLMPMYTGKGLKGNRVRIPDSPAAVKLHFNFQEITLCH